ncbi:type II toxin-antitoxin system RelE/ParE family toxin [Rhizobium sp. SG2393]|uniref:type II toxin-antitoxin system RelE/ParE family toxin n=1 Tax=Rhizobium sp. SG2393 TaxID=3276279 RepID=UPI00366F9935
MAYDVVRSAACERDLDLIFDHLIDSYQQTGDSLRDAFRRAEQRLLGIQDDMAALGKAPFQGTIMTGIEGNLRHVTKNRAIFYFDVDEARAEIRVLAVFFGGQNHQRHMLARLAGGV